MNNDESKLAKRSWLTLSVLMAIIILAAGLRLYSLTNFPVGFNADEAAIGYNAYSILHTGHDEHGAFLPISFKSFGDYKAPLYVYLNVPFVAILGLTELAVRLPSALFGIASVYLLYLFTKRVLQNETTALVTALFLAISPWHVHFSRGGWEVNVATFFILLGLYAFLKGFDKSRWFAVALVSMLGAMYTYQSPKLIVPLLGLGVVVFYGKQLWLVRTKLVLPMLIGLVAAIPLVLTFTSSSGYARFSGVSIFADAGPFWAINEARGEHSDFNSSQAKVFHNKLIGYGLNFLKNYSDHYTPKFLFSHGDEIQRNNIPDMGVLYLIDALFLALGLIFIFKSDAYDKRIIVLWLAIAPVAAAITFQTPHALRSANMVVPLMIVSAAGVTGSVRYLLKQNRVVAMVWLLVIVLGYSYCFARYLHIYYVHIPKHLPYANNYAFKELVSYVESNKDQYDKIIMTDYQDQPYILFLFYSHKDPKDFQKQVVLTPRDKFGFSTVRSYDNYEFRAVTPEDLVDLKRTLIIGSDKEIPNNDSRIIKTIYFPNGMPAFKILKT